MATQIAARRQETAHLRPVATVELSVIIKVYNEQEAIGRCLDSVFAACAGLAFEVIVADALSTDGTVEIAARYPVLVVRLSDSRDRSCGSGAQLGFQFARGRFVLTLDGDTTLQRAFVLQALQRLEAERDVAAVGGLPAERSGGIEFRLRTRRYDPSHIPGEVEYLNGPAVYRAAAVGGLPYLTNRNLHCAEEWELGTRLRRAGWRLWRIDCVAFEHYGYELSGLQLLAHRWRTRYAFGYGELIRASWREPHFLRALWHARKFIAMLLWWLAILGSLVVGATASDAWPLTLALILAGPIFAVLRKHTIEAGLYSFALWNVHAAGLLFGVARRQVHPAAPIPASVLVDRRVDPALSMNAS